MKATAIITFFILITFSGRLFACSCAGQRTVKEEIESLDAVLVGTVLKKQVVILTDSTMYLTDSIISDLVWNRMTVARYDILVEDSYKGEITKDTLTIYTGLGGGDCGIRFEVGKKYIIYGEKETYFGRKNNHMNFPKGENIFWTHSCLRTTSYYEDEISEIEQFARKKTRKTN